MARCQQSGHEERHKHGNGNMHCAECCRARGRRSALNLHRRRRAAALAAYGSKCACCGEQQQEFLAIDHVDGNGSSHRKEINASGSTTVYRWLEANRYPEGFQVLCHNCNYAKHVYGTCPHQWEGGSRVSEASP